MRDCRLWVLCDSVQFISFDTEHAGWRQAEVDNAMLLRVSYHHSWPLNIYVPILMHPDVPASWTPLQNKPMIPISIIWLELYIVGSDHGVLTAGSSWRDEIDRVAYSQKCAPAQSLYLTIPFSCNVSHTLWLCRCTRRTQALITCVIYVLKGW